MPCCFTETQRFGEAIKSPVGIETGLEVSIGQFTTGQGDQLVTQVQCTLQIRYLRGQAGGCEAVQVFYLQLDK